jgi:micrococcal nuclease
MKRNTIIAIGAAGITVLFFVMILDDAHQETTSIDSNEGTGNIDLQKEQQKESDSEIQLDISSKVYPVKQGCKGDARCISGFVTRIVDGDTLTVDGQSVRFALVNTPEFGESDYSQAKNYIENICPVGSKVLVDEDDKQTEGSHGRIIGVIYCNNLNLSEEVLEVGHAEILSSICKKSEFADEDWAQKFGC